MSQNMSRSLQFFIEKNLDEEQLVRYLNRCIPNGIETLDVPVDGAEYFAQLQDYDEGFQFGLNIACRDNESLDLDEVNLALAIAKEFDSDVLLEMSNEGQDWCLVDSTGAKYVVSILELDGGVAVNIDAGRKLIA